MRDWSAAKSFAVGICIVLGVIGVTLAIAIPTLYHLDSQDHLRIHAVQSCTHASNVESCLSRLNFLQGGGGD